MKRSPFNYLFIFVLFIGLLSSASCKRNSQDEPSMKPPASYHIILSGSASPSSLFVPKTQPAVSSRITVTALYNDGTPVVGKKIVFQVDRVGYLEGNQISDVRTTNASGVAEINLYIPAAANVSMPETIYVTATLIEDGVSDNTFTQVSTIIPISIIPYENKGFQLTGHILTPAGVGIGEVVVVLTGEAGHMSAITVSNSSGEYVFYVNSGWYGTITPGAQNYTFTPESYTIESTLPVVTNRDGLNFIATSTVITNKLAVDVLTWDAPIEGGSQLVNVYNLSNEAHIDYIVIPDSNWIRVSPSSGTTPGNFTIIVDENNTNSARSGKITISAVNTASTEIVITINQEISGTTASLAVTPSDIYVPASGNVKYTVTVSNPNTTDVLNWTLDSDATWLGITPTSGDTASNNTFEVKVQGANPTSTDRVARIYIVAKFNGIDKIAIVKVRQAGS